MSAHCRICTVVLVLTIGIALAVPASAHTRSQSFSSWSIHNGEVRMTFSIMAREATRLPLIEGSIPDLDVLLLSHLAATIRVASRGEPCASPASPRVLAARKGYLRAEWHFHCTPDAPVEISNEAFFAVAPSHIHYARVRYADNPPVEYLFSDAGRRHVISPNTQAQVPPQGTSFGAYVALGVEHILNGIDHIAFLLSLLILCRRPKEVALMVTGFTLGHSVTLSLAVLGILEPNVPVIDALIGFTIALVAAENVGVRAGASGMIAVIAGLGLASFLLLRVWAGIGLPVSTSTGLVIFTVCYLPLSDTPTAAARRRPLLTVLFGLIHGFGFARALMEIGLPQGRLASALFGFNVGVEIGQLGTVITLWVTSRLVARSWPCADFRLGFDVLSAGLCGLGLYWFVARAFAA